VMLCGTTSGKYIDKFSEASLTQVKAKKVSSPLILEALANIECKVLNYTSAGDHTLVTGEVVELHLPKDDKALPLVLDRGERVPQAKPEKEKPERAEAPEAKK